MESFKEKLLNGEINDHDFWVSFFDITHQTLYFNLTERIKKLQDELIQEKKRVENLTQLYKKFMDVTDCKCLSDCYETNTFCERCNLYEDFIEIISQNLDKE